MITGGARVGKTKLAINICKKQGPRVMYIATTLPNDDIFEKEKIRRSRKQRPFNWEIREGFLNIDSILEEYGNQYDAMLIENLTSLVSNLMSHYGYSEEENNLRYVEREIVEDINTITSAAKKIYALVVFVTNEVDIYPQNTEASFKALLEILGRVNQQVAALSNEVYMVVSGIPLQVK
ncbi:MAG: bifunctional adenosylcobinamide kinase/adenosylcobinamide-phosphate guanylyltransferase [Clostridiales bacterium]|jgi:adenosylcobinamide kinase/adenosylcobinamide-phosphate guanylyltransferase|nr:bifunctional adenosylcobinamide kinase/adenosylcobinamide-phosphate guanylyltransferase [Clostridiales bacterium]